MAETTSLAALLDEFEAYLADGWAWSNRAYRAFVYRFGEFGVTGDTSSDLVKAARRTLREGSAVVKEAS